MRMLIDFCSGRVPSLDAIRRYYRNQVCIRRPFAVASSLYASPCSVGRDRRESLRSGDHPASVGVPPSTAVCHDQCARPDVYNWRVTSSGTCFRCISYEQRRWRLICSFCCHTSRHWNLSSLYEIKERKLGLYLDFPALGLWFWLDHFRFAYA